MCNKNLPELIFIYDKPKNMPSKIHFQHICYILMSGFIKWKDFFFSPVKKPSGTKLLICLHHRLTHSFISYPTEAIPTTWNSQSTHNKHYRCHVCWLFLHPKKIFFIFLFVDKDKAKPVTSQTGRFITNTCILIQTESLGVLGCSAHRRERADGPLFTFCVS